MPDGDTHARSGTLVRTLLLVLFATAPTPLYVNLLGHVTLRSSDVLLVVAGLSFLFTRPIRRLRPDVLDAGIGLFLAAILLSGVGDVAFMPFVKALRPWLLAFAAWWMVRDQEETPGWTRQLLVVAAGGIGAQALFGAIQAIGGRGLVRDFLHTPVARVLYEPDVLAERLPDFYFNWAVAPGDAALRAGLTVLPSGTAFNASVFAVLMATGAALAALLAPSSKPAGRRVLLGLLFVASALACLTFKRTGWLAMACVTPVVLSAGVWRAIVVPVAATGGLAAFILFRVYATPVPARENLFEIGLSAPEVVAVERGELVDKPGAEPNSRPLLWRHAVGVALEHPVLGVGAGQFERFGPLTPTRRGLMRWSNPESSVVGVLVETGFVGLAAFGLWIALLFRQFLRAWARRDTGEEGMVVVAGVALFAVFAGACVNDLLTDDKIWPLAALLAAIVAGPRQRASPVTPALG